MLTCEFQGRCIFPHGVTSLLLSGWQGRKPSDTALRGCSEYIVGRLLEERGMVIRTQGVALRPFPYKSVSERLST